eukprot:s135_g19.t1
MAAFEGCALGAAVAADVAFAFGALADPVYCDGGGPLCLYGHPAPLLYNPVGKNTQTPCLEEAAAFAVAGQDLHLTKPHGSLHESDQEYFDQKYICFPLASCLFQICMFLWLTPSQFLVGCGKLGSKGRCLKNSTIAQRNGSWPAELSQESQDLVLCHHDPFEKAGCPTSPLGGLSQFDHGKLFYVTSVATAKTAAAAGYASNVKGR